MSVRTSEFYEQLLAVKVKLTDSEAIKKINPRAVRAYLENHGWVDRPKPTQFPQDVSYYGHPSDPDTNDAAIVLPKHYGDYTSRVGETIAEISRIEGRPQLAIYADLIESSYYFDLIDSLTNLAQVSEVSPDLWKAADAAITRQTQNRPKTEDEWAQWAEGNARWICDERGPALLPGHAWVDGGLGCVGAASACEKCNLPKESHPK